MLRGSMQKIWLFVHPFAHKISHLIVPEDIFVSLTAVYVFQNQEKAW